MCGPDQPFPQMKIPVVVEVAGYGSSDCSPFPCDETRSCGLSACHPGGKLDAAFEALAAGLQDEYGDRVSVSLIRLDEGVPERIREIISRHYPPLPMVLVNGRVTPLGRISLPLVKKEIDKEFCSGDL